MGYPKAEVVALLRAWSHNGWVLDKAKGPRLVSSRWTMITADQLVLHALGDYVIQSDWMANNKTKKSVACLAHAVSYTLPFLFVTTSWKALAIIAGTHFIIDRWRLARYICWLKNFFQPRFAWARPCECDPEEKCGPACGSPRALISWVRNYPWSECSTTGYHTSTPIWMTTWLLIIADNVLHVICNGLALSYL